MNKHILRSWIEVDFDRLESNVRNIKNSLPSDVKYIAVVKADAYGHCMPQALVRFLRGGADLFAVANLYEASRVREVVSDKKILVLSPVLKEERPLVFEYGATPALSSYPEAKAFDEFAAKSGRILEAHIKIDTGMGRAGVWHEKADDIVPQILSLPHIKINGMFSHLSSADTDRDYTFKQVEVFKGIVSKYADSGMLLHLHNSAALRYVPIEPPFNAVRMGLVQYGINPFDDGSGFEKLNLLSVLAFKARILALGLRDGKKIGAVCAGYADGVPAGFTSEARVLVKGRMCKILDCVGLDEMYVDLTGVDVKVGDEVTFIGEQEGGQISLSDYSRWTSRIPWETMVAIPRRVARIIK